MGHTYFLGQDDRIYYAMPILILERIIKYKLSANSKWFDMSGRSNEEVEHYKLINIKGFYSTFWCALHNVDKNCVEEDVVLKNVKAFSNLSKPCANLICSKSSIWFDEENKKLIEREMFICKSCRLVYYCSRRCQKYNWNRNGHKNMCKLLQNV